MPKLDRSLLAPLLAAPISETTSFLLALARGQAARRRPRDLVAQLARDAFVTPLFLDQRLLHRLDGLALAAATGFEALQLSPVAPLGVCSVVAPTSQDRTLTAQRGTEVVSDPTNMLAVVCAQRLLAAPDAPVRLCTLHQTLRAQSFPARAGYSRHFRLFALADAGSGTGEDGFEVEALTRHLAVFDRLFDALERELGYVCPERALIVRATDPRNVLADRLIQRVRAQLPHVTVTREPLEQAYYDGIRVMFGARNQAGAFVPIGDGGIFDWLAHLTSNRRFRFVASGFGLQLAPVMFGPPGV
ncbi:MAG: hypothetical protein ABW321_06810 [Polyangiales bacterium]